MTAPSIRLLAGAVKAKLETVDSIAAVYITEAIDVPTKPGTELVRPYAVIHPAGGRGMAVTIGGVVDSMPWGFQVTFAGSHPLDVLEAAGLGRGVLTGSSLTISDGITGAVTEDPSNELRTVLLDRDVKPARPFLPLLFRVITDGGG